jgi:hypothetical protein
MNPTIVGMIVFGCTFGGALLAMWLRTTLPEHHLDKDSRDTVKTSIGLIATMTALVLGLVTASAKTSFDAVDTAVKQTAAELLALDRVLARYGSETGKIRKRLQDTIGARIDIVWPQRSFKPGSLETLAAGAWLVETERFADAIQGMKPQHDSQRALQKRALDLTEALLQARWLVTDETEASIPVPFLVVLLCWLTIIFASFGLVAPRNVTVVTVLFVCALSVGSALFLILEMDGPFDGLLKVSPAPLRYALEHLNR